MQRVLEKVTAFITRKNGGQTDMLLFEHPNAGIQLPAGTVEPGEPHLDACLREAREETGLYDLTVKQLIGHIDTNLPENDYVIFKKTKVYARPDLESFDWAEFKRGLRVICHRRLENFLQVQYDEYDCYPDPNYVTYSITGWVPDNATSQQIRRYLYHLTYAGDSPGSWTNKNDCHLFRPFWASLSNLPDIIQPQRIWLDYAIDSLGYRF